MANAIRGEVAVKIGDFEIVMSPSMEGLAELSTAMGNPVFPELYQRLVGNEISATRMAIALFAVRGTDAEGKALDKAAAARAGVENLMLDDLGALQKGFREMFNALLRTKGEPEKNG